MAKREKQVQHPEYEKSPMDRRVFLRRMALASGIAGGAGYLGWAPADWPLSLKDRAGLRSKASLEPEPITLSDYRVPKPTGKPDVGVARADRSYDDSGKALEYDKDRLKQMLHAALDQIGGIEHYIQKGDTVLIKPNVAFDRSPNLGATSNPTIVQEMVRLVQEAGAKEVRVADNPIESPPDCFRKSKIDQAVSSVGGRIYLPDSNSFQMLHTPGAALIENWWFFYRPFRNVDKVIGISPVKDHNLCHASMGFKNWYGLLGGTRNQFHQDIHGIVSDFALLMHPTFSILDGTNILMENGPTGGDPSNVRKGNVVIASLDHAASDSYAFEKCLQRPAGDEPAYIQMAVEKSRNAEAEHALNELWSDEGRMSAFDVLRQKPIDPAIAAQEFIEDQKVARALDMNWRSPGRMREVHL